MERKACCAGAGDHAGGCSGGGAAVHLQYFKKVINAHVTISIQICRTVHGQVGA